MTEGCTDRGLRAVRTPSQLGRAALGKGLLYPDKASVLLGGCVGKPPQNPPGRAMAGPGCRELSRGMGSTARAAGAVGLAGAARDLPAAGGCAPTRVNERLRAGDDPGRQGKRVVSPRDQQQQLSM